MFKLLRYISAIGLGAYLGFLDLHITDVVTIIVICSAYAFFSIMDTLEND